MTANTRAIGEEALRKNYLTLLLYNISQRRHYITILSVYFLTLPDARAVQIGLYTLAGYFAQVLLETPSGYLADRLGHKSSLVLSKILITGSTVFFLLGDNTWWFAAGSAVMSAGFAFHSGTQSAFLHEILSLNKKEHEYTKYSSRLSAYSSLVSVGLALTIPMLAAIDIRWPLVAALVLDLFGLIITTRLVSPRTEYTAKWTVDWSYLKSPYFLSLALFTAIASGLLNVETVYRSVYLVLNGLPVWLVGATMAGSRTVWFGVGMIADRIERYLSLPAILALDAAILGGGYVLVGLANNAYLILLLFILVVGYHWGRKEIFTNKLLNETGMPKDEKATMLSVATQIKYFLVALPVVFAGRFFEIDPSGMYVALGTAGIILLAVFGAAVLKTRPTA